MKTYRQLFSQITSFDNLLLAATRAQRGKRYKHNVAAFHFRLEENLLLLQRELRDRSYQPGSYQTFYIHDPKQRMISAAPYRDRVVHHALCQVIEPIFERTFIFDSYANRKGKGVHRAIERFQHYARRYAYVLKCDIRKFFPSLDHAILKQTLRWKIRCPETLWLMDRIIDQSNAQEEVLDWFAEDDLFSPFERRRGLPIGNLTSQFWGNVYLNPLDHFIKEELRVPGYIRYVDDFVLFSDDKHRLWDWQQACAAFLSGLRLRMHPHKTQVFQVRRGVPFLGFQLTPHHRMVQKAKIKRYRRHLRRILRDRETFGAGPGTLEQQLNAWLGHLRFGSSRRLEIRVFHYLTSRGVNLFKHPRGSWRVLEQQYEQLPRREPEQEQYEQP